MKTFEEIWALLNPKTDYQQLRGKCRLLWNSFSEDKQETVYQRIEEKKNRKEFVDYNPLFAIQKNSNPAAEKKQILSFNDYYNLYGTTEPRDGWQQANPTGNKVIYIKN